MREAENTNRQMGTIMMGWAGELSLTGWILMAVCMLAFWAVVLYLMSAMFRTNRASSPKGAEQKAVPLQVIEGRFARGEVAYDEFVAPPQVLTQTTGTADGSGR